jgi:hypothetical protein
LHDARSMLQDGNFRAFVHFQSTIEEAIFRLLSSVLALAEVESRLDFNSPHEYQNR